jgi:putative aldouronate transport system permease protein
MAIVYIATITGMDTQMFEAARIDGASRLQIIMRITIPYLRPIVILMTLFSVGRIFYGDFGMIYGLVQDNAMLFSTTDVIDTYVYRMLRSMSDYGMATAVGMLQSIFGLVFVYTANHIARKLEPGSAIF